MEWVDTSELKRVECPVCHKLMCEATPGSVVRMPCQFCNRGRRRRRQRPVLRIVYVPLDTEAQPVYSDIVLVAQPLEHNAPESARANKHRP